jgi:hypothetical protein
MKHVQPRDGGLNSGAGKTKRLTKKTKSKLSIQYFTAMADILNHARNRRKLPGKKHTT